MTRKPFHPVPPSSRAIQVLEIIHSDIAGPLDPVSLGGAKYILRFTDDFTRFKVGYMLKKKSDAFQCFKDYKVLVEKQHGRSIQKLRTDGGGNILLTSSLISWFKRELRLRELHPTPLSRMELVN